MNHGTDDNPGAPPNTPEKLPSISAPDPVPASDNSSVPDVKGVYMVGAEAPAGMYHVPPAIGSSPITSVAPAVSRDRGRTMVSR